MNISKDLIDILICPLTKDKLLYDEINNELVSPNAKLSYSIKDGIPILLIEESKQINK